MTGGSISAVQYSDELSTFSLTTPGWQVAVATTGDRPPQLAGSSFTSTKASGIFLVGGRNAVQTAAEVFVLQPSEMVWRLLGKLAEPRCYHSSTLLKDGDTLFVFGGSSNKGRNAFLQSAELITLSTGHIQPVATENPPEARTHHAAALVHGKVYIWGGKTEKGGLLNDLARFDPKTGRWETLSTTGVAPSPRFGHAMVALKETLYLFGGTDSSKRPTNLLFSLDTKTLVWSSHQSDRVPALSGHASFEREGKLFFVGWADQFQFLQLSPNNLGFKECPSLPPWEPAADMERSKNKSKIASQDLASSAGVLSPRALTRRDTISKGFNKKVVVERIEKLEFFSDSVSKSIMDLIQRTETEMAKENPFSDPKSLQEMRSLCSSLQQFCVTERPPRSWSGYIGEGDVLQTVEKPPFPLHHYESLKVPPKRIQVRMNSHPFQILTSRTA